MPTRYLKPGVRDSDAIDRLSPLAETMFYRLLVTVDDFGRFDARASMLKAQCFPIKDQVTGEICAGLMRELCESGLIEVYTVESKPYLQMCKWDNAPRAKESKFPSPADGCIQMRANVHAPRTVLPVTVTVTGTETENRKPRTGNRKPEQKPILPTTGAVAPIAAGVSVGVWGAYSAAYEARYGATPVRNGKVNAQLAQFVSRIGAGEAPAVAAFYVGHQGQFYVRAMHATDLLLRDAEKLRTEWATGTQSTNAGAALADRTQTNLNAFAPMIAEARSREAKENQDGKLNTA